MKIRSGFVSNSSSSSFILYFKDNKNEVCPHCGRYDTITKEDILYYNNIEVLEGKDRIIKYYEDYYNYGDYKYTETSEFKDIINKLDGKNDTDIVFISLNNDNSLIKQLYNNKHIDIIYKNDP